MNVSWESICRLAICLLREYLQVTSILNSFGCLLPSFHCCEILCPFPQPFPPPFKCLLVVHHSPHVCLSVPFGFFSVFTFCIIFFHWGTLSARCYLGDTTSPACPVSMGIHISMQWEFLCFYLFSYTTSLRRPPSSSLYVKKGGTGTHKSFLSSMLSQENQMR